MTAELEPAPTELPDDLRKLLQKARRLHYRGMRARVGSNERTKCLTASGECISAVQSLAADRRIPLASLPEWSRRAIGD